jgi:hypothetical protein
MQKIISQHLQALWHLADVLAKAAAVLFRYLGNPTNYEAK